MEGVDALGLVLDPCLDVVELGVGVLRLLVDLLGEPLQLLQPLYLVVYHLVALLNSKDTFSIIAQAFSYQNVISDLVEHHELVPVPVDGLGVEFPVEALARVVLEEALDVAEGAADSLLLVQPRRDVLHAEPLRILGEPRGNDNK